MVPVTNISPKPVETGFKPPRAVVGKKPEAEFVNFKEAQEKIPTNQFRQPM
jgi:hypothetical protein